MMATEMEKKEKLEEIEGLTIYGLALGMWELFGESSFATSQSIGEFLLTNFEAESGLEIEGETPEHILTEVARLLTDEVGLIQGGKTSMNGDTVTFTCQNCSFSKGSNALEGQGVQPFYCPVYNVTTAALRERLGKKSRFAGRTWDQATKTCTLKIQLMQ
jgi:hypothetical protein